MAKKLKNKNKKQAKSKKKMDVVFLTSKALDEYAFDSLKKICLSDDINLRAVFVNNKKAFNIKRGLKRLIKKERFFIFPAIVREIYRLAVAKKARKKEISIEKLKDFCKCKLEYVDDLYSHDSINLLQSYKPHVCFHYGFGIIKEPILSIPKKGVIGYHHGDLTRYRGSPNCFWEIYNNEKEVGVTIQQLKEKLDSGAIITQKFIPVKEDDTLDSLRERVHLQAVDLGLKSILLMQKQGFKPKKPEKLGGYYSSPTIPQHISFLIKMAVRKIKLRYR